MHFETLKYWLIILVFSALGEYSFAQDYHQESPIKFIAKDNGKVIFCFELISQGAPFF